MPDQRIAIVGGGPAGLMAAETLSAAGLSGITVYERKPSPARKFLMAGRGGLNITHSEDIESFMRRYVAASGLLRPAIDAFTPDDMREWCAGLGEETFIGTSGRVFPKSFKASPLLRAWLERLSSRGVQLKTGYDWRGWNSDGTLKFNQENIRADAVLLALGGGSWGKLGSDGGWVDILNSRGVAINPLRPANCGFTVAWSDIFSKKYAGQPIKPVAISSSGETVRGEIMISATRVEGGAIYALSALLRDEIERTGRAVLNLDLHPDLDEAAIVLRLSSPRGRDSFTNYLRKTLGLSPVAIGLVYEAERKAADLSARDLARLIKSLPLRLSGTAGIDRAISSAGGVKLDQIDGNYMLKALPGVFAAGEMLDWEAPTGGYLLQATFATGAAAARGMIDYLSRK